MNAFEFNDDSLLKAAARHITIAKAGVVFTTRWKSIDRTQAESVFTAH